MQVVVWFACFITVALGSQLPGQALVTPLGPFGGDVRSLAVHPEKPNLFFLGTSCESAREDFFTRDSWGVRIS